jgi:hypothetical protein
MGLLTQIYRGECNGQQSLVDVSAGSEDFGVSRPFEKDRRNQMDQWVSSQDSQPMHQDSVAIYVERRNRVP